MVIVVVVKCYIFLLKFFYKVLSLYYFIPTIMFIQ